MVAADLAELLPFLQTILTSVINSFEVSAADTDRPETTQPSRDGGLKALAAIIDQLTLQVVLPLVPLLLLR